MSVYEILFMLKTSKIRPDASMFDVLTTKNIIEGKALYPSDKVFPSNKTYPKEK